MKTRRRGLKDLSGAVFLFALAAASTSALAADVGESRPPAGTRSLFDNLFVKETANGTFQYDIPPSFEGILERLREIQGGEPLAVTIPMGRSVQRLETDLKKPRVVAAFSANSRALYKGRMLPALKDRLFLGYGKESDQLEVISYNQDAARFEFQLVKNLSNPTGQKVLYAPREFCSTCHIHQAPFFPRDPWEETGAFPATATAMGKAMGLPPNTDLTNRKYLGVKIGFADNSVAYAIDGSIDVGASQLTYQKLWGSACDVSQVGGNLDPVTCRSLLLKLSLRRLLTFSVMPNSPEYAQLVSSFLPKVEAVFGPLVNFPISDLRTRNPLTASGGFSPVTSNGDHGALDSTSDTINRLRSLTSIPRQFDPLNANPSTDDPYMYHPLHGVPSTTVAPSGYLYPDFKSTDDQPKIRKALDPVLLSDTITWLSTVIALDRDYYKALRTTGAESFQKLDQAIDKMASAARESGSGVLAGEPVTADKVLAGIGKFARDESFKFLVQADRQLPAVRTEIDDIEGGGGGPNAPTSPQEVAALQAFKTYCGACHGSGAALEYFPGDFSKLTGEVPAKILRRIDWERCKPEANHNRMPPTASSHRKKLCQSASDRSVMIEALRQRYFGGESKPCGSSFTLPTPLSAAAAAAANCASGGTP